MPPVVIAIQRDTGGEGLAARLYRSPRQLAGAMDPRVLALPEPMPTCDTLENVSTYGAAVYQALAAHNAIQLEIMNIQAQAAAVSDVLQFRIETPAAERYRWETLCPAANQFLAVAPGHRITRVISSLSETGGATRTYTLPLRLVAFLSALGVPAQSELNEFIQLVASARAAGLDIDARIYLGEQDLLVQMQAAPPAGFTFLPMPQTADAMKAAIKSQEIQFLHLFGHGAVRAGVSALEFGTITDNLTGADTGSVKLVIDELVTTLELQKSTWLTVLNSCSGAQAFPQFNSMAFKIAERGSPFALGMNEPIDAADATQFTRTFYREVFDIVRTALAANPAGATIDLSPAIVPVRQRFYAMYETEPHDAFGRWSLPVLYENPTPLEVRPLVDRTMKARVDTVAASLRSLPADTPLPVREQILALLDQAPAVPANARPDAFGAFPGPPAAGGGA